MPIDTTLQDALGQAVREVRVSRKMSQEAFAARVGLHRTYVGSVERGERNVSLINLSRIADALGMKTSELIGLAEQLSLGERAPARFFVHQETDNPLHYLTAERAKFQPSWSLRWLQPSQGQSKVLVCPNPTSSTTLSTPTSQDA